MSQQEGSMFITPVTLLLSASIADILITLLGLGLGLVEINPIVSAYGWVTALLGKLIGTLFVVFMLTKFRCRLGGLAFTPGLVVSTVVLWNILMVALHI
jgi:hypothetical protein